MMQRRGAGIDGDQSNVQSLSLSVALMKIHLSNAAAQFVSLEFCKDDFKLWAETFDFNVVFLQAAP